MKPRTDITLIVSTIPTREKLLKRSIQSWADSLCESKVRGSIRIQAEGYETFPEYLLKPLHGIDVEVHCAPLSGSQIAGYNYWIPRLGSPVVVFGQPEMLFPTTAFGAAMEATEPFLFTPFKAYFLGQSFTDHLDVRTPFCDWIRDDPRLFSDDPSEKGSFYSNTNITTETRWDSVLTYAMMTDDVKNMYPYWDFHKYGRDDPWHALQRSRMNMPRKTIMEPILFHQWHKNESESFDVAECYAVDPPFALGGQRVMFKEHGLAHALCAGWGLEIGAGRHNPFGLHTMNVDVNDPYYTSAQIDACGHAARIDILSDAKSIPVQNESQQFVVSSHVVEHMNDTVAAFVEWDRVTALGGVIFMIHPRRDALPADIGKPLTTLEHHITDYEAHKCVIDLPGLEGHFHAETIETMQALVMWMNQKGLVKWELIAGEDVDSKVGNGFTLVYRKMEVK